VFGQDGSFSYDALVGRYNSDLANGLGNLASRTLSMIQQYRAGKRPANLDDDEFRLDSDEVVSAVLDAYEQLDFSRALEKIWSLIGKLDKLIVKYAPWKLAKHPDADDELSRILHTALAGLHVICRLAEPVIPHATEQIWRELGYTRSISESVTGRPDWGTFELPEQIGEIAPVFPRLDPKPTITRMQELEEIEKNRQAALVGKPSEPTPSAAQPTKTANLISIDDFSKVDLRVGEVKSAEPVKGADKLLDLKVDIGEPELRTIIAGIALAYRPEQLIGRKVVIVANLQPRKLRGLTSQGMIVAASTDDGPPVLAGFHEDVPVGAHLK
jgi:methionyl-tRNA synthetase